VEHKEREPRQEEGKKTCAQVCFKQSTKGQPENDESKSKWSSAKNVNLRVLLCRGWSIAGTLRKSMTVLIEIWIFLAKGKSNTHLPSPRYSGGGETTAKQLSGW